MITVFPYLSLALTAFLAATVLPFSSELVMVPMLLNGFDPGLLWLSAATGNTLGSVVNWFIGVNILRFQNKRWFPVNPSQLARAQAWFGRYGVWSLLLAWLPVGGDTLTLIAGVMRVRFWLFFVLTAIGKGVRYAVIVWLVI